VSETVQVACPACLAPNRVPAARVAEDPKCGKCGAALLDGAPAELGEDQLEPFVQRTELRSGGLLGAVVRPVPRDGAALRARRAQPQGSRAAGEGQYEDAPGLAARYNIRAIPTLVLFKNGTSQAHVRRTRRRGAGAMGRLKILLAVLAVAGLAACGETPAPKPAAQGGEALKAAAVELRDVELTTSAEAVMEAVRQSTVSAQIAGRVVDLRFDVGDYVKKGDVILRIDERSAARALEASEAQVLEAQAALANARANYERSRQLLAQKFISQAALDQAEAAYKSAQARVGALVAGAGAAATSAASPPSSHLQRDRVRPPHRAGRDGVPGRPLMTGFDPSTLRVVATVPQAQVAAIQAGGKARIEVPSLGRWVDVKAMTIVPAADPRTHTTRIRLDLPEEVRGVYPGVYARAHFVVGRAPRLLVRAPPCCAVAKSLRCTWWMSKAARGCGRFAWAARETRPRSRCSPA